METVDVHETEVVSVIIFTSIAFLLMGILLVVFYYFSRKKIVEKELEKRDLQISHQKDLLQSIILTQEVERKRIAQDLHDDISSKLNIVSLNTHLLTTPNLSEKETKEITTNIIDLTHKALENSRRIAHDLLPPVLEKFGLHAAVEELCHEVKTSKSVAVSFQNFLTFEMDQEALHLQVFRILQELINNSLRHGKATEIKIQFQEKNGWRRCDYSDNGNGFDMKKAEMKKGLGMKNIESRVEIFKGKLTYKSAIGKGVQVSFTF